MGKFPTVAARKEARALEKFVAKSAEDIKQRAKIDFDREAADVVRRQLDTIGSALRKAEKASVGLVGALHRNCGKYIPASLESECGRCRNNVVDALVAQNNAVDKLLRHIQSNPSVSGHDLHRQALEAAYEYCCGQSKPRGARELARQILEEAGVPKAVWGSPSSVNNWLKVIRSGRA